MTCRERVCGGRFILRGAAEPNLVMAAFKSYPGPSSFLHFFLPLCSGRAGVTCRDRLRSSCRCQLLNRVPGGSPSPARGSRLSCHSSPPQNAPRGDWGRGTGAARGTARGRCPQPPAGALQRAGKRGEGTGAAQIPCRSVLRGRGGERNTKKEFLGERGAPGVSSSSAGRRVQSPGGAPNLGTASSRLPIPA